MEFTENETSEDEAKDNDEADQPADNLEVSIKNNYNQIQEEDGREQIEMQVIVDVKKVS